MRGILFVLVCGIGTLNGVFLAGYLWLHRRGDAALNRLLAALLITFTFRVSKAVAVFFLSQVHPLFELLWIGALGATGVTALLYVRRLAGTRARTRRLLLRAGAIALGAGALVFFLIPLATGWKLMGVALAVYGGGIAVVVPLAVSGSRDLPREALRWPRMVVGFLGAVWLFYAVMLVGRLRGEVAEDTFFDIEAVVFSLVVYAMLYAELRSGLITRTHQAGSVERISGDDPMLKRLRHAMEVERLYLDPSLSLPSLAKTLKLPRQHVSKLLNAGIGASFNDYVNRLRVEEVQRLLALPDGASRRIGQLGFDVGFNSSSVFYAAFRKFTGRTPSEYVKDLARN